jgi:hypothetical protein
MSNKMKGAAMHPANQLSNIEIAYNAFIRGAKKFANAYGFSKHVGSKSVAQIKHMCKF